MGLLRRPERVNWGTKDSRRGELGPNSGGGCPEGHVRLGLNNIKVSPARFNQKLAFRTERRFREVGNKKVPGYKRTFLVSRTSKLAPRREISSINKKVLRKPFIFLLIPDSESGKRFNQ